jgi:hypothetical protein
MVPQSLGRRLRRTILALSIIGMLPPGAAYADDFDRQPVPPAETEPADSAEDTAPGNSVDAPELDADAADGDAEQDAFPELHARAQRPEPVALHDVPDPPSRLIEVGPFFGYTVRPSSGDLVRYGPGFTWGMYMRPELTSWLGARIYFRQESIPVDVRRGGYEVPEWPLGATDFDQPNLRLRSLGIRFEPTWVINPRLRLLGIVGIAWLRFVAPEPTSRGDLSVQTAARSGVELNPMTGLGVSFDVVPDWLLFSVSFTYGLSINRSGSAYEVDPPLQGFADGRRLHLAPLPQFESVTDLLFSVGLIL